MKSYFQSYSDYVASGGSHKSSTIKPQQLLPAIVANMAKLNKQFTLNVNGRVPKNIDGMLVDAFEQSHLQQPFYTQHCEHRSYRYGSVSKNRIKIEFTVQYRMNRAHEKWMLDEINNILSNIVRKNMTTLEKIVAVHDYIAKTFTYDLNTTGSPYAVYTFMKEKHGVCMAYALLFEKMMEMLDIPCYYVIGQAEGESDAGHAWNMVELDGQWYHIDVTWDDLSSKSKIHQIRYRYFLVSDDKMKKDHIWNLKDYPPCTSEKFASLHALYDVSIVGNRLYYPHQKTAYLYSLDLTKQHLQPEKLLDVRVQLVTHLEGILYFSNYSNKGYLNSYHLETAATEQLNEQQIIAIHSCEAGLEVTNLDLTKQLIEKTIVEETTSETETVDLFSETLQKSEAYTVVPIFHFDTTWMATYEQSQKEDALYFKSEDGVGLIVEDTAPQLTVELFISKGIDLQITTKRKDFELTKPAILVIPFAVLPTNNGILSERLPSGELIQVPTKITADTLYIQVTKSLSLVWS